MIIIIYPRQFFPRRWDSVISPIFAWEGLVEERPQIWMTRRRFTRWSKGELPSFFTFFFSSWVFSNWYFHVQFFVFPFFVTRALFCFSLVFFCFLCIFILPRPCFNFFCMIICHLHRSFSFPFQVSAFFIFFPFFFSNFYFNFIHF